MMGKITLLLILLGIANPTAEFDVQGTVIYMDRQDGTPIIAIKVEEISKEPVYIEKSALEAEKAELSE